MTEKLFELIYKYQDNLGNHSFQIGYFSSEEKTIEVIHLLEKKPGFADKEGEFLYELIEVEGPLKNGAFYELSYEEYLENEDVDYTEMFGIFSSYASALKKQREITESGNGKYVKGDFTIAEVKPDLIGWAEGFNSW